MHVDTRDRSRGCGRHLASIVLPWLLVIAACGVVPQVGAAPHVGASAVATCSANVLEVSVEFNGPGNPYGAMTLTNNSSRACALSGRPTIGVFDAAGKRLNPSESNFRWHPSLPRPTRRIVMTPKAPWGIVEMKWCGFKSVYNHIDVRFDGWRRPLEESSSTFGPQSFKPPACTGASASRLAVDYLRKLGPKGIAGRTPRLTVTPDNNLRNGEKVAVTLSGFDIGGKIFLSECATIAATSNAGCGDQLAMQPFVLTNMAGSGTFTFVVRDRAATNPFNSGHTADCTNECVLLATGGFDSSFSFAHLDFAAP